MTHSAANSRDQLTLAGIVSAVETAIESGMQRHVAGPKTKDPRRPLEKYPQRMTVAQVATYLNCSENHVRNLYDEGKLEGKDIALADTRQALRIFRDSVAEYETKKTGTL
jgi:excisionase family DNA binding protein